MSSRWGGNDLRPIPPWFWVLLAVALVIMILALP